MARLRGGAVVLIQHEWGGLHWLRRITYIPALLLADTIVMFSPLVRRELAGDPLVGWTAAKMRAGAVAAEHRSADWSARTPELRKRLAAARHAGRLVIGHFGSIYPGKQPNALLEIGAILKARGLKPLIVYIGSFIRGVDRVEEEFHARAANSALPTTSSSAAMSPPTTRCSACSARSTPSAIRSMRASPRGAPASSPACNPAGR